MLCVMDTLINFKSPKYWSNTDISALIICIYFNLEFFLFYTGISYRSYATDERCFMWVQGSDFKMYDSRNACFVNGLLDVWLGVFTFHTWRFNFHTLAMCIRTQRAWCLQMFAVVWGAIPLARWRTASPCLRKGLTLPTSPTPWWSM